MKLRMKNWYWRKYVEKPLNNTTLKDYEEYKPSLHGFQHAEEACHCWIDQNTDFARPYENCDDCFGTGDKYESKI